MAAADISDGRSVFVTVQFDLMARAVADGGVMTLPLPGGAVVDAAIAMRDGGSGRLFVSGPLLGSHRGEASLTVVGDTLSGRIVADGRLFLVHRDGETGPHRIVEAADGQFPPEAPPRLPPPQVASPSASRSAGLATPDQPSGDSNAFIDTMVLYTPAARVRSGSTSSIVAEAVSAVNLANVALTNSGAQHRLRLVHVEEVPYVEDGNTATSLDRLTTAGDGQMDNVTGLRNLYRADVVTLLTADTDACGVGWLMGPNSINASFEAHAYSVVVWSCAAGNLSLAHEIGHNMGLQHDRPNGGGALPAFTYAYGYGVAGLARDVMAYPTPCTCPRTSIFSTPSVNFPGISPATPAGTPTENAARALNNTSAVVANFRQSLVNTSTAPPADFDGDARSDLVFFRPSTGTWHVLRSGLSFLISTTYSWGLGSDTPVSGDFDGDGKADLAVFRTSSGIWYVAQSSAGFAPYLSVPWGLGSDRPVPADYDGDRRTDIAVFRPASAEWFILRSSEGFSSYTASQWGVPTDVPVPADYDGDGKADLAVFRPSDGTWYVRLSTANGTQTVSYQWGVSGDVPVVADYDGDARADLAVFRPSTGTWYLRWSSSGYSTSSAYQWGTGTDQAVPGDYDGDGRADLAVFRPATGTWYVRQSTSGFSAFVSYPWGTTTDQPVIARR